MKVLEEIEEKCCSHCEAECDGCWLKELVADYTKQARKEVVREIIEKICRIEDTLINLGNGKEDALTYFVGILNEIENVEG
jgi:hypothetical protein